jgi:hypothetical protein
VNQPFSRIVTALLLGTMFASVVGTMCLLPASPVPSHTAGCHHSSRFPTRPQPADYQCCIGRHPVALLTGIFSPPAALQPLAGETVHLLVPSLNSNASAFIAAPSGGPPNVISLRI